jgi:hypothetical protein
VLGLNEKRRSIVFDATAETTEGVGAADRGDGSAVPASAACESRRDSQKGSTSRPRVRREGYLFFFAFPFLPFFAMAIDRKLPSYINKPLLRLFVGGSPHRPNSRRKKARSKLRIAR